MPGHDHLRPAFVLDDERRRPGVDLVARHAPQLVAGALVERDDERRARHVVVPDDDERVAVERRRRALAELVAHLLVAEVLLPDQRAVHVVAVEAARLERGDDVLAVGDRRARRPRAVVLMRRLVRRFFAGGPLPSDRAVRAVDREHLVGVRDARGRCRRAADGRRSPARPLGTAVSRKMRSPQTTGRRRTAAGNLDLPLDVLGFAPLDWRIRRRRHAGGLRTAPLRPEPIAWAICASTTVKAATVAKATPSGRAVRMPDTINTPSCRMVDPDHRSSSIKGCRCDDTCRDWHS